MELTLLAPQEVKQHWHLVRDYIQSAIDYDIDDEDCIGDIYHRLLQGNLHLHAGLVSDGEIKFAVVCSIDDSPKSRIGTICFLGSDLSNGEFLESLPDLEKWFKSVGCSRVRVRGRPGWKKLLTNYEPSYTVLSREL